MKYGEATGFSIKMCEKDQFLMFECQRSFARLNLRSKPIPPLHLPLELKPKRF
jgi:hypothetical protein